MRSLAGLAMVLGCGALAPAASAAELSPNAAADLLAAPFARLGAVEARTEVAPIGPATTLRVRSFAPPEAGGRPLPGFAPADPSYAVTFSRDLPKVSFEGRDFGVDFAPHAGVGVSREGGRAEAGATLQLRERRDAVAVERLKALGVRDGASLNDRGRWYLFAAASGRAVGMNMLHSDQGWDRAGWTTDPASTLVGDAQVGVGWRKGALQTSVGYIHREIKGEHMLWGVDSKADSLVAFSIAVRPH